MGSPQVRQDINRSDSDQHSLDWRVQGVHTQLVALMVHYDLAVLIRLPSALPSRPLSPIPSPYDVSEYLIPSLTTSMSTSAPTSVSTTLRTLCYLHVQSRPLPRVLDDPRPKAVLAYDELFNGCLREGDFYALVSQWALASPHATLSAISRGCVQLVTPQATSRLTYCPDT